MTSANDAASNPTVSLVTVTYNSADLLAQFWSQLLPEEVEWIVVDNASRDGSAVVARELGARVVVLPENVGFSAANNRGLDVAVGEFVGFVNPDVQIEATALASIVAHLRAHGGFAAPQLLNADGSLQPNGRDLPSIWSKVLHRLIPRLGQYRRYAEPGRGCTVVWAMGAALFGRREDFARIGGWNEQYFLYYEDAEIGIRGAEAGIPTTLCGTSQLRHGWERATTKFSWSPWRLEFRAAFTFYSTHAGLLLPPFVARRTRRYRAMSVLRRIDCSHG